MTSSARFSRVDPDGTLRFARFNNDFDNTMTRGEVLNGESKFNTRIPDDEIHEEVDSNAITKQRPLDYIKVDDADDNTDDIDNGDADESKQNH